MTEKIFIKPCPFCGVPLYQRNRINPLARCDTVDCWMNSRMIAIPVDDHVQVREWNTRARDRSVH